MSYGRFGKHHEELIFKQNSTREHSSRNGSCHFRCVVLAWLSMSSSFWYGWRMGMAGCMKRSDYLIVG